jgi:putative transposase
MRYSQYINKQQNITGILWQGRFFSSPLDEQYTYYGFAYVVDNNFCHYRKRKHHYDDYLAG